MTLHETSAGRYDEDDNTWFTLLTMNTNQNHFNSPFAARAPYGKLIVNSGLPVADTSHNAIMNLGWDEIRLTHPIFVDDTLHAESIVVDKRESRSRPGELTL